jgi:hypothetical protein
MAATSNAGPSHIVDVDRHPRLVGLVLRAYLIATIKSIGLAWEELARGNVHEGEDTVTDTCQLSLLQEVPVGYALGQIGAAVSWLEQAQAGQSQDTKDSLEGLKLRLLLRKVSFLPANRRHHHSLIVPDLLPCPAEHSHDLCPVPRSHWSCRGSEHESYYSGGSRRCRLAADHVPADA